MDRHGSIRSLVQEFVGNGQKVYRTMTKQLRLLYASERSPYPIALGGAARSSHQLMSRLVRNHAVDCFFLSQLDDFDVYDHLASRSDALGIRELTRGEDNSLSLNCGYPIRIVSRFYEILEDTIKDFQPTAVCAQLEGAPRILKMARNLGVPAILYVRDACFDKEGVRELAALGVQVVANSAYIRDKILDTAGVEAHLVYSILEAKDYQVTPDPEGYITMINADPKKGIKAFLGLAALLPKKRFLLVEAWPLDDDSMRSLRSALDQLPQVEFLRRVDDVRKVYRQTSLLLVPSVWEESQPRVVLEAQVSGIPIIASCRGALPDGVGDGGIIVDDYLNPSAWVEAIESVDAARYATLADKARINARRPEFSVPENVARFLTLLKAV